MEAEASCQLVVGRSGPVSSMPAMEFEISQHLNTPTPPCFPLARVKNGDEQF